MTCIKVGRETCNFILGKYMSGTLNLVKSHKLYQETVAKMKNKK